MQSGSRLNLDRGIDANDLTRKPPRSKQRKIIGGKIAKAAAAPAP
jgi:hypothetical protein